MTPYKDFPKILRLGSNSCAPTAPVLNKRGRADRYRPRGDQRTPVWIERVSHGSELATLCYVIAVSRCRRSSMPSGERAEAPGRKAR
jgi:hypothetical protein